MKFPKITARKFDGDDKHSWAIFRSDKYHPIYTGLGKSEVPHYKMLVQKMIDDENKNV